MLKKSVKPSLNNSHRQRSPAGRRFDPPTYGIDVVDRQNGSVEASVQGIFEASPVQTISADSNDNNSPANPSTAPPENTGPPAIPGQFAPVQLEEDLEKEEPLQGKFASNSSPMQFQTAGEASENRTGMPDRLKAGIEHLAGYAMDDVKVHYNSPKPAQLHAHAYTQGSEIHVAPGQEKHLPHEAWHVVQQKQGRVKPTMQAKGVSINDDAGLEHEADVMGGVVQKKRGLAARDEFTGSSRRQAASVPAGLPTGNSMEVPTETRAAELDEPDKTLGLKPLPLQRKVSDLDNYDLSADSVPGEVGAREVLRQIEEYNAISASTDSNFDAHLKLLENIERATTGASRYDHEELKSTPGFTVDPAYAMNARKLKGIAETCKKERNAVHDQDMAHTNSARQMAKEDFHSWISKKGIAELSNKHLSDRYAQLGGKQTVEIFALVGGKKGLQFYGLHKLTHGGKRLYSGVKWALFASAMRQVAPSAALIAIEPDREEAAGGAGGAVAGAHDDQGGDQLAAPPSTPSEGLDIDDPLAEGAAALSAAAEAPEVGSDLAELGVGLATLSALTKVAITYHNNSKLTEEGEREWGVWIALCEEKKKIWEDKTKKARAASGLGAVAKVAKLGGKGTKAVSTLVADDKAAAAVAGVSGAAVAAIVLGFVKMYEAGVTGLESHNAEKVLGDLRKNIPAPYYPTVDAAVRTKNTSKWAAAAQGLQGAAMVGGGFVILGMGPVGGLLLLGAAVLGIGIAVFKYRQAKNNHHQLFMDCMDLAYKEEPKVFREILGVTLPSGRELKPRAYKRCLERLGYEAEGYASFYKDYMDALAEYLYKNKEIVACKTQIEGLVGARSWSKKSKPTVETITLEEIRAALK